MTTSKFDAGIREAVSALLSERNEIDTKINQLTKLGEVNLGRGRPKGSTNKAKVVATEGKGRGRPKGSKNKPKEEVRGRGRPKGSTNKAKTITTGAVRGRGRPKGSKNKPKEVEQKRKAA